MSHNVLWPYHDIVACPYDSLRGKPDRILLNDLLDDRLRGARLFVSGGREVSVSERR